MVENITLENTVTGDVLELDKVTTPFYILESVNWGQVKSNHHTYKHVDQVGDYLDKVSLDARDDIEIIGWVIGRTEELLDQRKRKLNMFVNPQQKLNIYYKEYVLGFNPDTSIKYGDNEKENNNVMCKFKIEGVAHNPLFENTNPTVNDAIKTRGYFHFPLIINTTDQDPPQILFGIREPGLLISIINEGQVSTGFTVRFVANGVVKNPSLINANTMEYIKINKTLQAGEVIEVNTIIGERSIMGGIKNPTENYFKYKDFGTKWLQLPVGESIFSYDAEEGKISLDVFISYNNKYLEVQECL